MLRDNAGIRNFATFKASIAQKYFNIFVLLEAELL